MVETQSISKQLFEALKKKILLQEFKPGEQIKTRKLSEKYDVSLMPVRDALKELETQGLVINKERVGFFVRKLSPKEIKEIIEVRKMYELYCLCRFHNNINTKKLKKLLQDMKDLKDISRDKFNRLDKMFHDLIIRASDNQFIINKYTEIECLVDLVRHLDKNRENEALKEHIVILELILEKNITRAKKYLEKHINNVRDNIIDVYKKDVV